MKTSLWILPALMVLLAYTAFSTNDVASMKQFNAQDWTVPEIEMQMKLLPAGSFTMGSPTGEICRRNDEVQHPVVISKPFYMAAFECRQREFYTLMMPENYDYQSWTCFRGPLHDGAAYTYRFPPPPKGVLASPVCWSYPMETISWDRAVKFCRKLTERERQAGRLPDGYVYRLPTEAEWEYACRAGTSGPYSFTGDYNNAAVLKQHTYAGDGGYYTFGVGNTKSNRKPNPWGLYDMHGNVWEWCLDWYAPYQTDPRTDPAGPADGKEKVVRGGSCAPWFVDDETWFKEGVHPFLRSAARYSFKPDTDYLIVLGFRVVLAPELKAPVNN